MKLCQKAAVKLKKAWRRLTLRGVRYSSDYKKLDAVYAVPDPWGMASSEEQFRFRETNRFILEKFGSVGSILEIGCGEGHQSVYLQSVCKQLTGIDVSERAVKRAQCRCPRGEFLVGDIFSPKVSSLGPFDLIVACEVIYYMRDVPGALEKMRALGRNCLITYYEGELKNLDPQVLAFCPEALSEVIEFQKGWWRVTWWYGCQPKSQGERS